MTQVVARHAGNEAGRGRGIQSVEVGHRLLAALVEAGKPMILRDLAAAAGLAPAQAHAYLASFRRIELVEQDAASGRYSLGPFAMRLGLARMRSYQPLAAASKSAIDLSQRLGLMVCVVVWGPQAPTVVQVQEGAHQLNLNIREGTMFSVTGTASGRVFGAFSKSDLVQARIEAERTGTVVSQGAGSRPSREELDATFAEIRRLGYAATLGRPVPGINAASAPVFDGQGNLLLVLTLIGAENSLTLSGKDPALATLLSESGTLSERSKAEGDEGGTP
jgi:DNA-binding IclR family transcriptional regulator